MYTVLALVVVVVVVVPLLYVLAAFLRLLIRQCFSPLRSLPGPPSPSIFLGNLREMHDQENNDLVQRWAAAYGSTFVYRGFLNGCRLMTTDPVAASYILGRAYDYPKPDFLRDGLADMVGGHEGILVVEGEDHRRQRKVLTPAFTAAHIRSLSPIFWQKAVELRNIWLDIVSSASASASSSTTDPLTPSSLCRPANTSSSSSFFPNPFASFVSSKAPPSIHIGSSSTQDGARIRRRTAANDLETGDDSSGKKDTRASRVDVLAWSARATLDVIGEAGFGYAFNSLSGGKESELAHAFGVMFSTARKFRVITILQVWFPILRKLQHQPIELREAHQTMQRIGMELIEQKRKEIFEEKARTVQPQTDTTTDGRDLLNVLIRSNLSSDPTQRLSTNETLCQISTFIAAGHETTASALTWSLYALARVPDIQRKLRAELRSLPLPPLLSPTPITPSTSPPTLPSADTLAPLLSAPYLDAVVRECLRLHAPVTNTMRVAAHDDVVPLSSGAHVRLNRGDIVTVPISALNRGEEEWGVRAGVFEPERWLEGDADRHIRQAGNAEKRKLGESIHGLWGNMLTFLNGNPVNGNRACIGWRFAVSEIKVFLGVLVRDLEFTLVEGLVVEKKINVVTRPWIQSEPHLGNQMPLRIRYVPPEEDDS